MRDYYSRKHTPRVKPAKGCRACSLKDECLPGLPQKGRVAAYIEAAIKEEDAP
jgi:CRISPR-associated exonuclease Cas4